MRIQELKINNFGKIKNKQISLGEHINIIYGKNEAGKSTILKYIINSFYGISKNKKGKEYSDLEKYKPWTGEEFSGKLKYELDNGKVYEVFRDFKKKNPKIFNENMEDISNQFSTDKTSGIQFFSEQTGVGEELFLSTFVSNQQEIRLQKNEQNILIQKISNLVGTGEDNVSYKMAIDRINRRQLEEIGTMRTREKPINILERRIMELEQEKQNLQKYEIMQYEVEEKENEIIKDIDNLENQTKFLNELKILFENENIEKEKIELKQNIKKQNIEKIKQIDAQIDELQLENKDINKLVEEKNNKENKANNIGKKTFMLFIIIIFLNILQMVYIKSNIAKYTVLGISIIIFLILTFRLLKKKKNIKINLQKEQEIKKKYEILQEKIKLLQNEIQILEKNNQEIENEIIKNRQEIEQNTLYKKNQILKSYPELKITDIPEKDIQIKMQTTQNEIANKKIVLHTLEIDKNNIIPNIEKLAKVEEQYANYIEQKKELEKLNTSMLLAKEILQNCYEEMKHTITPKFTDNLSKNISQITNSKYTNVKFNDEHGLIVETETGEYVSASKLSIGTIEQLYLSLRLSMIEELSDEKLPVILDEAFAYFDDERLENFLTYIYNKYFDRQILIFTCTQREIEILEKNKLKYNLIKL